MLGTDEDLLIRARNGDRAAGTAFIERQAAAVRRLARAIVGNDAGADDVTQEAFTRAWSALGTFDPARGPARTWLYAIARHAAFETVRGRREWAAGDSQDLEPLVALGVAAGWGGSPEHKLLRAAQREELTRALASLAPADREVLVLRDLDGLAGEEVAAVLGIEVRAMKSRLHRARLKLLAAVQAMENGVVTEQRTTGGMTCSEVLAVLSDYLDGELGPTDRTRVEQHVRDCSVCERFGGRFAGVVHALRRDLGAPPAMDDAVLEGLRARMGG